MSVLPPVDTSQPRVSVVIPAYNQAAYLREAIDSVLAQTYRDFEIIVVDDESTDATAAIARSYGDPVRYVWQQNLGLAGARNTGIRQARGELIGLLDSDDLWLPAYLETMVKLSDRYPQASVYFCSASFIDTKSDQLPQINDIRLLPPDQMLGIMLRYNYLFPCTILMRRQDVLNAGCFDQNFREIEDWELWLRMLLSGYTFQGIPDRLAKYRLHEKSLTGNTERMQQAVLAMTRKLFGPDDRNYSSWSQEKRRSFGGVYRYQAISAVMYLQDWSACASHLQKAFLIDPSLAEDEELYYELALGSQPRGYRGTREYLTLEKNAELIQQVLLSVFAPPRPESLVHLRRPAFARAYHALGQVAYNIGDPGLSRRYWLQSLRYQPSKAADVRLLSMLARSFIGKNGIQRLRRLRRGWL